ncbi:F-box domain-containing protein [Mycena chlorophos]|uniref:F-box domain-containing protein n=1 Tax=Mycena chlorophos TaxID=658473 RepID=A0A8H6SU53_MYCCL|nr:F-box domain-containing protein [Mycena chlorophos]
MCPESTRQSRAADRARIREIQERIEQLSAEKETLQRRLDGYSFPVLTLPNEITSEIFRHFLPPYPQSPPCSGSSSPTLLAAVCRHWRNIALATPGLWCAISLDASPALVSSWLDRSGRKLLSLRSDNWLLGESAESVPSRLGLFLPSMERWEHIQLRLPASAGALTKFFRPMPMVLHMELDIHDLPQDAHFSPANVPSLRSAALWEFDGHINLLPWSQLTALALITATPEECTRVLPQATNLVACALVLTGTVPEAQAVITLPRVKRLTLTHYDFTEEPAPIGFLSFFATPVIQRLRIAERLLEDNNTLQVFVEKHESLDELCIMGRSNQVISSLLFPGIQVSREQNLEELVDDRTRSFMKQLRAFVEEPLLH